MIPHRSVETRAVLEASPAQVWAVLTDVEGYARWSPDFRFSGVLDEGRGVILRLRVAGLPLVLPVRVARRRRERELSWAGGPPGLVRGHHYLELRPVPDEPDKTELIHGERFDGLALPLLWPVLGPRLEQLYAEINAGLAEEVRRRG